MSQNTIKAMPLAVVNANTLSPAYVSMNAGTGGFIAQIIFLRISNNSNTVITVSYDGITDNELILANTTFEFASQMNSTPNAKEAIWSKRTQVYIKAAGAGVGSIALSGYYV